MKDINLLGEDKFQNEGDDDSENFSQTYSSDSKELTSDSNVADSDMHSNYYDKSYTRSSSKKATYIIGALFVIAAFIIGYLLYKFTSDKSDFPATTESDISAPDRESSSALDTPTETGIIEAESAVNLPAFERELISATQKGVSAIESINALVPQNVNFTVIRYSDGNFLAEMLGNSSEDLTRIQENLLNASVTDNVNILSQEAKNVNGVNYQKALINGVVTGGSGMAMRRPEYLDVNSVKERFSQYCEEEGMRLKQFDIKSEVAATEFTKIPVMFKATGGKGAAVSFLKKLVDNNINVNLSKIVLIQRVPGESDVNLILNMDVYTPI